MAERMVHADGVGLCAEAFGDPADAPILLVMGLGASMLWWDEGFCRILADGERYVIRYDHRDTGRSTACEPGHPGYRSADLVSDAGRVLDGYGVHAAHLVGVSAGGALAQVFALDHPHRVLSLVLISTSPATPGDRDLPPPTDEFLRSSTDVAVDWSDHEAVIEHLVGYGQVLAGGRRPFDDVGLRQLVRRDVERARNIEALQNHDLIAGDEQPRGDLASIVVPTLVIHGTADPMFPLPHGEALAAEIPGATLLRLEDAGHGIDPADRAFVARAILEHTSGAVTPHRP
jgi:pimeloyl-ACP methyl ester carboxylesterase